MEPNLIPLSLASIRSRRHISACTVFGLKELLVGVIVLPPLLKAHIEATVET